MILAESRSSTIYDFLAPPLILVTPFISFINYNDYSYAAAEIWISVAGLIAAGLLCGAIVALGTWWLRIIVMAGLVTLFVDLQFDLLDEQPWLRVPVFGAGMLLVCWLLRGHLGRIATPAFATMLAATSIFPGASGESSFDNPGRGAEAGATSAPTPPVLVHLIFDEFIGVEGIPSEGQGPAVKEELRSFFDVNGFYLFARAYSRFPYTRNAIPNTLNYASAPKNRYFVNGRAPYRMRENQYFADLHEHGYSIHVYQTDFMDFCTGYETLVVSCRTYVSTGIKSLEDLQLSPVTKAGLALGIFSRLSVIQRALGYFYSVLRQEAQGYGYQLPRWAVSGFHLTAARGMHVLDIIADDVAKAPTGGMFFAHLILPHYPYTYGRDCNVRDPHGWDVAHDEAPLPPNSIESRARRYALYLGQILCLRTRLQEIFDRWRRAGIYDRMKIVLQGDHGSRIHLHKATAVNRDRLLTSDYTDSFSTLFAVKIPGLEPAYDMRFAAIQDLLAAVAHEQRLDRLPAGDAEPYVFLDGDGPMMRQPMPEFGDSSREGDRLHISQP